MMTKPCHKTLLGQKTQRVVL